MSFDSKLLCGLLVFAGVLMAFSSSASSKTEVQDISRRPIAMTAVGPTGQCTPTPCPTCSPGPE
jgi:hypothetical protein